MSNRVGIIEYGAGNLSSVMRAVSLAGAEAELISCPEEVLKVDRLILPGVGAFSYCMHHLVSRGVDTAIQELVATGCPVMGVCLGMQLLTDRSSEFGETQGLGLIPGSVVPIKPEPEMKIPHIGWASPTLAEKHQNTPVLSRLSQPAEYYFAHSFFCDVDPEYQAATFDYHQKTMTAAIARDNVIGVQFHPELSGQLGVKIYQEFIHWK
ncbi:MAG: imidazole glycerol phosphate synthase subunit HisH [Verrucomicrobiota bacterium]